MRKHFILRVVAKILIPFVLLFALYVQFHGDFGPGGGFQAGVIFAAGIILYTLVFGLDTAREVCPRRVLEWLVAGGLLLYGLVGALGFLLGDHFLDYSVLSKDAGQHVGILLVELGVGVTVAAVVVSIFFMFVDRGRH
ncbi:Na(+)/H(+) antiporter subunit B [Planctomycetaceae bacterium]|nr:Na(+)/H(+) antiporter subunit B [Planctomycetaceae bacterium]